MKENLNTGILILDYDGIIYYRKSSNEMFPNGKKWEPITMNKDDDINKFLDFDIGPKDMMAINANGRISVFYDFNRPKINDI